MRARDGGVVAVGVVGLVLVLIGVVLVGSGTTWFYATQKYSMRLADTFDGVPKPPAATPMMVWAATAGVFLTILGILIISLRRPIVERWLLPTSATSDGPPSENNNGSVTAVGVAGLCFAVIGLSEVLPAIVVGITSGWDDDWTFILWSGLPFLIIGSALVLRPRILARWWKP
jgi:hypothetical protein